jgi:3-deoxy-manno-octulosonate cytidylyltransferase (CMP-KDO synthetase)
MTSQNPASGTDRIAEVAASLVDAEIVVNLQGDEPLVSPLTIERAIETIGEEDQGKEGKGKGRRDLDADTERSGDQRTEIVTTWEPMESASDVLNPDVVKIVVDQNDRAVYFSRSPVPYPRDAVRNHGSLEAALRNEASLLTGFRKHTGLYVYRRNVLLEFTKWPQSELEKLESLEQLRLLEHGVKIKAIEASTWSIGVDTIEDLQRVRSLVEEEAFSLESRL